MRRPEDWSEPFHGAIAWALVGGATLWLLIAFGTFEFYIAYQNHHYARGPKSAVGQVTSRQGLAWPIPTVTTGTVINVGTITILNDDYDFSSFHLHYAGWKVTQHTADLVCVWLRKKQAEGWELVSSQGSYWIFRRRTP